MVTLDKGLAVDVRYNGAAQCPSHVKGSVLTDDRCRHVEDTLSHASSEFSWSECLSQKGQPHKVYN